MFFSVLVVVSFQIGHQVVTVVPWSKKERKTTVVVKRIPHIGVPQFY